MHEFNEYEQQLLRDPAFQEEVLYQMEKLAEPSLLERLPLTRPPRYTPTVPFVEEPPAALVFESSLVEQPIAQEEGEKLSPARHTTTPTPWIWIAVLLIAALLVTTLLGSSIQPVQPPRTLTSSTADSVLGAPSISATFITMVLKEYRSPAAQDGQALYDLGVTYGIDPVFALAFFMHESSFGTRGMATITMALGNERCIPDHPCVNTEGLPCQTGQSCYAQMLSWEDGFEHWYQLLKDEYITGHINQIIGRKACPCTTIAQIIPVYAPGSDHNDEQGYIAFLRRAVETWRHGKVEVPA